MVLLKYYIKVYIKVRNTVKNVIHSFNDNLYELMNSMKRLAPSYKHLLTLTPQGSAHRTPGEALNYISNLFL